MKGMQRIKRGVLFKGVLKYVFDRKGGHTDNPGLLIDSNMAGLDTVELVKEFNAIRKERRDIEKPVWHNSLRLPKGDKLTHEQWTKLAEAYLNLLGLDTSNFQYVCILHDDEDGQHIHIIANRIGIDGTVYLGRNENLISTRIISQLEKEFGLTITKNLDYTQDEDGKHRVATGAKFNERKEVKSTKPELAMEKRKQESNTSYLNPKNKLSRLITDVLAGGPTTGQFIARLEKKGIKAVANVSRTGTMNGFSFEIEGQTFKGSQVKAAWSDLLKSRGLDYDKERDNDILQAHHVDADLPKVPERKLSIGNSIPTFKPTQPAQVAQPIVRPIPSHAINLNYLGSGLWPVDAAARYNMQSVVPRALEEYEARCEAWKAVGNDHPYTWTMFQSDFMRDREHEDGYRYAWWGEFHRRHKTNLHLYYTALPTGVAKYLGDDEYHAGWRNAPGWAKHPVVNLPPRYRKAIALFTSGLEYRHKQAIEDTRFYNDVLANKVVLVGDDVRRIKRIVNRNALSARDIESFKKAAWRNMDQTEYLHAVKAWIAKENMEGLSKDLTSDDVKIMRWNGNSPKMASEQLIKHYLERQRYREYEKAAVLESSGITPDYLKPVQAAQPPSKTESEPPSSEPNTGKDIAEDTDDTTTDDIGIK